MINWRQVLFYLNWVSAIALLLLIGLALGFSIYHRQQMDLVDLSYLGTIAAAVISFIGVILLYKTYKSQKEELRATQEALRLQKVDSAFFNMLSLLQEMINAMSDLRVNNKKGGEEEVKGRVYLNYALSQLKEEHMSGARKNMRPNPESGMFNSFNPFLAYIFGETDDKNSETVNYSDSVTFSKLHEEVAQMYEGFYSEHQQNLGHYFRYIYNIIKYVLDHANGLKDSERKRYLAILQSQLSNDEMGLIFYNVLSKHGTSQGEYRFLRLLDDFRLLENMDRQSLKHEWHHWLFPKTIFKFLDEKERERKKEYIANLTKFNIPK